MKIASKKLLENLIRRTRKVLLQAEQYLYESEKVLNRKPDVNQWSILECLEHLNRYGDFYLPEIERRIENGKAAGANEIFKSSLLGNYFAESMLPKEKLNKMKTFKNMNPAGSDLNKKTVEKFIAQQKHLLRLLEQASKVSLNKVKTSISLTKWIKLRLGDTFRVVIYHNQRHMVQAEKVQSMVFNTGHV